MKEKSLQAYLTKAKYLLVFVKNPSPTQTSIIHKGVHIPSLNFYKILTTRGLHQSNKLPLARVLTNVRKIEELALFPIALIYYTNENKEKNINGWKVPSLIPVSRQFESVFKNPLIPPYTKTIRKYNVAFQKEALERSQKDDLALEKEHSRRRNYLTTSSLHT